MNTEMNPNSEGNLHGYTNLMVTATVLVSVLSGIWMGQGIPLLGKILLSPFAALVCLYIGHRFVPRGTGSIIEAIIRRQRRKSQQDQST
jgi:hypothetical protein